MSGALAAREASSRRRRHTDLANPFAPARLGVGRRSRSAARRLARRQLSRKCVGRVVLAMALAAVIGGPAGSGQPWLKLREPGVLHGELENGPTPRNRPSARLVACVGLNIFTSQTLAERLMLLVSAQTSRSAACTGAYLAGIASGRRDRTARLEALSSRSLGSSGRIQSPRVSTHQPRMINAACVDPTVRVAESMGAGAMADRSGGRRWMSRPVFPRYRQRREARDPAGSGSSAGAIGTFGQLDLGIYLLEWRRQGDGGGRRSAYVGLELSARPGLAPSRLSRRSSCSQRSVPAVNGRSMLGSSVRLSDSRFHLPPAPPQLCMAWASAVRPAFGRFA